jgi:hypothetical protein
LLGEELRIEETLLALDQKADATHPSAGSGCEHVIMLEFQKKIHASDRPNQLRKTVQGLWVYGQISLLLLMQRYDGSVP